MQQINSLHDRYDELQNLHGDTSLNSIYGAGDIKQPKLLFIFMNPTARNITSQKSWEGLRAPWIGTKQVWNIFAELSLISASMYSKIREKKPDQWDVNFASSVYLELENNKIYLTNLAKCTQIDARPLKNSIFKDYLPLMIEEISIINPSKIITFGNQVSSILLQKTISVSKYTNLETETLTIDNKSFTVYPTFYPVGQGQRNMPAAIKRIRQIQGTI